MTTIMPAPVPPAALCESVENSVPMDRPKSAESGASSDSAVAPAKTFPFPAPMAPLTAALRSAAAALRNVASTWSAR